MAAQNPLEVGIVGGGLAGLSAAIALKRAGHRVEIFEKTDFKKEAGITLAIAPNAGLVYQSWGFDLEEVGGVEGLQVRHVDGATAKITWQDSWKEFPERYGAKVYFLRHGSVHSGLLRHMEQTSGIPVKLSLETEITSVDCAKGTVQTSNGTIIQKDLVVLASGLSGRFIKDIIGQDVPLQDTGLSFFRYLVPNDEINEDPEIKPLFENQDDEICFLHNFAVGASVVTYLCEGRRTRAVNVFAKRMSSAEGKLDRNMRISQAELLHVGKTFHPSVQAILKKAPQDRIFSYPLMTRDPVTKYVNGKMVMIGDAAHVMRPYQGQGASIAIESAGCLELLFKGVGKDEVQTRLQWFETLRLGRCGPVHVFSNMPLGPDGHAWMVEKIRPFWDTAKPLPPPGSRPLSQPFRDFIYGFDVMKDTQKALDELQARNKSCAQDEGQKTNAGSVVLGDGVGFARKSKTAAATA